MQLHPVVEEVTFVKEQVTQYPDLVKLLTHPQIAKEEKIQVIEKIFRGQVSDDLTGFLVLI